MKYEPFLKGAGNNSTTTSIHDGKLPVSLSPHSWLRLRDHNSYGVFEKTESARCFVKWNG